VVISIGVGHGHDLATILLWLYFGGLAGCVGGPAGRGRAGGPA